MKKETKICLTVKAFLEHPNYPMTKLAQLPELASIRISRTTILKYLKDPLIIKLFGGKTYDEIQVLLKRNRQNFRKLTQDELEKRRSEIKETVVRPIKSKEQIRMNHIYTFTCIHLKYPNMSFETIADFYNENNNQGEIVTEDYIRECLATKSNSNFFADNIWIYKPINLLQDEEQNERKK